MIAAAARRHSAWDSTGTADADPATPHTVRPAWTNRQPDSATQSSTGCPTASSFATRLRIEPVPHQHRERPAQPAPPDLRPCPARTHRRIIAA